jgi:hypothetical protein
MEKTRRCVLGLVGTALISAAATARAEDISGVISATKTITEDSQLVGQVTCTVTGAACIALGAPGITLNLNGFTITGLGDAVTGCGGANNGVVESGIDVSGQRGVVIRGPGVVQRFRSSGIRINMSTRVLVTEVTASTNCMAGIWVIGGSDHELESNISVRNGNSSLPSGGI